MTTARALLMRLLTRGRIHPAVAVEDEEAQSPESVEGKEEQPPVPAEQRLEAVPAEQRLEAARRRLKETIPPPEEKSPEGPE